MRIFFLGCFTSVASKVKTGEVKKARSEELFKSSGERRSEVVVHCRSTPSLQPSLLALFFLPRIPLIILVGGMGIPDE